MRKEAKIGLALVGGFVVLIVGYLLLGGGGRETGAEFVREDADEAIESIEVAAEPSPRRPVEDPSPSRSLIPSPADSVALADPFRSELGDAVEGDISRPISPGASTHRQNAADWARILETGQVTPLHSETPARPRDPSPPAADSTSGEESAQERPRRRIPLTLPQEDGDIDQAAQAGERIDGDQPAVERTHIVEENETFSSIALKTYGSANYWPRIVQANPDVSPERLRPGMEIILPAIENAAPRRNADSSIDPRREYRVQQNDSLYTISQKLYGRGDRVDELYDLNREAIGPDPARLRLDMVLQLPDPPTTTASTR